jgi:hypothetical protein
LLGETREKIRAAWSLFTPCTLVDSLLEAVSKASENAISGDVVLLSPACSSIDMFQNYQHRGEVFRQAVEQMILKLNGLPANDGSMAKSLDSNSPASLTEPDNISARGFLRESPVTNRLNSKFPLNHNH